MCCRQCWCGVTLDTSFFHSMSFPLTDEHWKGWKGKMEIKTACRKVERPTDPLFLLWWLVLCLDVPTSPVYLTCSLTHSYVMDSLALEKTSSWRFSRHRGERNCLIWCLKQLIGWTIVYLFLCRDSPKNWTTFVFVPEKREFLRVNSLFDSFLVCEWQSKQFIVMKERSFSHDINDSSSLLSCRCLDFVRQTCPPSCVVKVTIRCHSVFIQLVLLRHSISTRFSVWTPF